MSGRKLKSILGVIFILCCVSLLTACDNKQKKKATHDRIVIAKLQTPISRLYYSSTLSPIATLPVVTPVAGTIEQLLFSYGEKIRKGENLLVINSQPLAENYRKAVSDFLQKKQAYETGKLSYEGTQALYKAGVIPQSQYSSERTQFNNNALDYLQAQYQLEKVLQTANIDPTTIEVLSISDTDKVNAVLQRHFRNIVVKAPMKGIALYPSGSGNESGKKLTVGGSIKENQLLLLIGNLTGLSAKFKVSEVDIDQIKKNMPVKVTSNAFPDIALKGYVSSVSSQAAQDSSGSGLSMFLVSVKIPKLSAVAMKKIRVGMTAKFEIDIKMQKAIMLPIDAVFQKGGQAMVTILDKQGIKKAIPVVTGATSPVDVVIKKGVKPGDRVVIHD